MRESEKGICKVCMVSHDEDIHAATLSIHGWFREQVTLGLWDEADVEDETLEAAVA